ncbi:hypothetical protein TB2_027620 [Malus domestica]
MNLGEIPGCQIGQRGIGVVNLNEIRPSDFDCDTSGWYCLAKLQYADLISVGDASAVTRRTSYRLTAEAPCRGLASVNAWAEKALIWKFKTLKCRMEVRRKKEETERLRSEERDNGRGNEFCVPRDRKTRSRGERGTKI